MDILIITISDGSFHVVHNVTIDPSMEPPNTEQLVTSERLSTAVRAVFTQSGQDVDFSDVNRITGIMPYDGCATFIWIQEYVPSIKRGSKIFTVILLQGIAASGL